MEIFTVICIIYFFTMMFYACTVEHVRLFVCPSRNSRSGLILEVKGQGCCGGILYFTNTGFCFDLLSEDLEMLISVLHLRMKNKMETQINFRTYRNC